MKFFILACAILAFDSYSCEALKVFENGKGMVDQNVKFEKGVYIENGSTVCGSVYLEEGVIITGKSRVSGQVIINKEASVHNSTIVGNIKILSKSRVISSTIEGVGSISSEVEISNKQYKGRFGNVKK